MHGVPDHEGDDDDRRRDSDDGDGGDSLVGMGDFLPLAKAGTCRKHGRRNFVLRSHPWRYLCADCDIELYGPVEAEVAAQARRRTPSGCPPPPSASKSHFQRARGIERPDALPSEHMADEKQDQQRADRNHERTEEAHWQVAEAGAEEEKRAARPADEHEDDWENEGGALGPEPRKTDEPNDENL
jgi:hypothetical protein